MADLVLLITDAESGLLKHDRLIMDFLRKKGKKNLVVVNKIDKSQREVPTEFKKLGNKEMFGICAASGAGIGDLLDKITQEIPNKTNEGNQKKEAKKLNMAIVGKPNVGKSSLLNQILKEEKCIVSDKPHTTREPVDTLIEYENQLIRIIDTAGIRRKNKVKANSLEASGIHMSIKELKRAQVALFVLDGSEEMLSAQDSQLAGLIVQSNVSLIFVLNKYDMIDAEEITEKEIKNNLYRSFPFLTWAPIIFTSAKTGRSCQKVLARALEVYEARNKKIDSKELQEFFSYLIKKMPPPRQERKAGSLKKSRAYIKKFYQITDATRPIFVIESTNKIKIPESYLSYLENNLRERFNFIGTPIEIIVKRQENK